MDKERLQNRQTPSHEKKGLEMDKEDYKRHSITCTQKTVV